MNLRGTSRYLFTRLAQASFNVGKLGRRTVSVRSPTESIPRQSFAEKNTNLLKPSIEIKKSSFKRNIGLDSNLSGLVEDTKPFHLISESDLYYVEGINESLAPKNHPLVSPQLNSLVYAILKNEANESWVQFERLYTDDLIFLKHLTRTQWSQLFILISESTSNKKECWARTELIFNAIMRAGHEVSNSEFARLIQTASRAGLIEVVQEVWNAIYRANHHRSIELWNTYLRATCNADETLWYRRFNGSKSKNIPQEPRAVNDALQLVSDILADGLSPNSNTYELVLLYLGQRGDLEYAAAVISAVWGIKLDNAPLDDEHRPVPVGSILYPQISSLVSIINAYGASNQLVEGLKMMEKMQALYHIPISGNYALLLWETVMKWSYYSTDPFGATPEITLNAIWKSVTERYNLEPNGAMFHYKTRRELSLGNYDAVLELIPSVLKSHNVKNGEAQAKSILHQTARSLFHAGRLDDCYKALDKWAPVSPAFAHVKEKMERYISKSPRRHEKPTSLAMYQQSRQSTMEELSINTQPA